MATFRVTIFQLTGPSIDFDSDSFPSVVIKFKLIWHPSVVVFLLKALYFQNISMCKKKT